MRAALLILTPLIVLAGILFMVLLGTYTDLNSQEIGVRAMHQSSAVVYDKMWKSIKETAQVSDRYASDFKEVFIGSIEGRYEGKNPAVSLIMEAAPNLDSSVYTRVQAIIEQGRAEFMNSQQSLVDRQRRYGESLTSPTGLLFTTIVGVFPREQMGDFKPERDRDGDGLYTVLDYPTVTSGATRDAFRTGEAEEVNVFGD